MNAIALRGVGHPDTGVQKSAVDAISSAIAWTKIEIAATIDRRLIATSAAMLDTNRDTRFRTSTNVREPVEPF